jgi:molybdate transport system substrate-binding protein
MKAPMEAIAADYQQRYGVTVDLQLGPSQTLLANLQVTDLGDLYLPADESYLGLAEQKSLLSSRVALGSQRPLLVCAKSAAERVRSLADATKVALPNPDSAAIGKLVQQKLGAEKWASLSANAVTTATVTEAANAVKSGSAEVTLIWDSMLKQYPDVAIIPCPELDGVESQLALGLLKCSKDSAAAMKFARFTTASDAGLKTLAATGVKVIAGDPWSESPELTVYAGSMLRPAIDETLTLFEKTEGVRVTRVYNGCGILVGQMKAGRKPDAYFACDEEFMQQVQESFQTADSIAQNQLVILVAKGNPKGITDLRDLAKPGVRLGVGHEKQCAMGWITQKTFSESGITEQVMKNVTVQTPTGDMLVNQMLTGSLDAAVTYLSNAVGAGEKLDAVRIQGIKCAIATQPFAVWKETPYQQLTARLHSALRSADSKIRFENEGFTWK